MTTTVFRTAREAREALSLDMGFDPFVCSGWGRCTKEKLADAGYVVDPEAVRRDLKERSKLPTAGLFCWADDCGGREGDGSLWDYDVSLTTHNGRHEFLGRVQARGRSEARKLALNQFGSQFSRLEN